MKQLISIQKAKTILLYLLGLLIVFHVLVIVGLVPGHFVWGNQIPEESILPMEMIAIVLTISFMLFVMIKMRYLAENRKSVFANIALWIIGLLLSLSALLNLISEVSIENLIFAPLALVMSLLTIRVAIEK